VSRFGITMIVAGVLLLGMPAFSQSEEGSRSEVSAQFFGKFVHSSNKDGVQQSSSNSGGILAAYRFFFSRHHGIEANYSYSRSTATYSFDSGTSGVGANRHEWSGAYVLRFPIRSVTPFFLAGAGGLTFAPLNSPGASTQTRAAFVYGAGANVNMTHHVFIKAQYRGFVYNSPTFNLAANRGADRVTHLAEPSVGLGVRF